MRTSWAKAAVAVLLAAVGGVSPVVKEAVAAEGSFARVKTLTELVPGDYVVTGSTKGNASGPFAMKNELGGTSTTYIQRHGEDPLPIEGLTDSLVDPDDSIVWTLTEAEGGWTLYNAAAGVYAAYKGSANSATFVDTAASNATWTLSEGGAEGLFALENAAKPGRILQYNGTSGSERFACYTNYGTRAQGLTFWRKDGSGGGGGVPHAIAISPYIENGTLATDPAGTAEAGTQVVVTGIPSDPDNWHLAEVTVTHESSALSYIYTTSGEPITFEMPDEDVSLSARFEQGATPGPGPGIDAIIFEGDDTGTVGGKVSFTASAALFGATVWLKTFEPPEGSALTADSLGLDLPSVTFVPDVPGEYRFVFATAGDTAELTGKWTVTVAEAPGPGDDGIDIEGDDVGTVGEEVTFTVVPAEEGTPVYIQGFAPPEGSSVTMDTLGLDFPLVSFVPDVPGEYHFLFVTADATAEWLVTVLPSDEEELRITKIEVHGTTVRLEYIGDAASVEGTDDLTDAASWATIPPAVLDPYTQTATLPARKHYLRLSTEPLPTHSGVQLWKNGPYWAETNVGADNPEDPGLYFWWGDTLGYRWKEAGEVDWAGWWIASDGSETNHIFNRTNAPSMYKDDATLLSEGWITEEGVLAPEHDAAQAHWGGDWCMPTDEDFIALSNKCDWTWTELNGVTGYLVSGRGDYANYSIFLPTGGDALDWWLSSPDNGFYWASVTDRENGYDDWSGCLLFGDTNVYYVRYSSRFRGKPVRPVRREIPVHTGVRLWEGGPEWAETNVGADNPEDAGLYFWWGDTLGYKWENDAFVASDGSVTDFSFSKENTPTYGLDADTLLSAGWTTAEGVLAPAHDAAQAHWGGTWRMPTDTELSALTKNCDWTWTTQNGVDGYEVRGKGDFAEASIFLPAVGYGDRTSLKDTGTNGFAWSDVPGSDIATMSAWNLVFNADGYYKNGSSRFFGFSVRPVRAPAE